MTCIKYLMFFFNLLIFLAGAALLGIGIWIVVAADSFRDVVSSDPLIFNAVYIIIAVGAALFLIGFLGCCGAVNENRCLLGTFFAFVLVLFLLQIVGAVLAIVLRVQTEELARETFKDYSTNEEVKKGWDTFQQAFECCGVDGPGDWTKETLPVPNSCCASNSTCTVVTAFDVGCKERVSTMFWILAGVAFGILLIELLALIFSCCLYRSIGESGGYA